jgi:putative aldouronate transport system permease protein
MHNIYGNRKKLWKTFVSQKYIQIFVLLGILFLIIFCYIPMIGILIAFKNYDITSGAAGLLNSKWVGLKFFIEFVKDGHFLTLIRNTFAISILKLIFTFPIPILFAIMIDEVKNIHFKKFVQTVSYLPHFISWVVVSGIIFSLLSTQNGLVNNFMMQLNIIKTPISFNSNPDYFWGIAVISDAWKEFGWWAIIFLAAIASIDQGIFESAIIDGAGRIDRILYITLPSIKSAISVVLILALGNLIGGGLSGSNFDQSYLMGNSLNISKSEIIETYVLKVGLSMQRFSYAAAVGLLQSIFSVTMLFSSNLLIRKTTGSSLY